MLLRLVRRYLAPYRRPLTIVVLLQFIGTMGALYLPSLNADIIDNGVITGDTGYILRIGAVMLGVAFVQIVCSVGAVWFGARTAMSFGRDVRGAIFHRVGTFSQREVQDFGAPSLITRQTNDVQQVQMLVLLSCTLMVMAPIMMVGGIIMAIREDLGLSWLIAVTVPVLAVLLGFIISRMVPSFRLMQARIDEVNRLLREQITGVRVVRAFVREPLETERFATANQDLTTVAIRAGRWQALMFPTVMLVANVASVAVLWFGGHRVESGEMQIGALTAYLSYLLQIVMAVMMGTFMMMMIPRSAVCADRMMEVLDTDSSVVPAAEPVVDLPERGTLAFENVEFSYPGADAPVLQDLTFRAEPGQTVAVIGSTGAGKSTLVNLVPRLFDVTGGTVAVDGVDVRRLGSRRAVVSDRPGAAEGVPLQRDGAVQPPARQAPRRPTRSSGTRSRSPRPTTSCAPCPRASTPPIVQGGTNVSGGQRQRLAIARAVVRRPEIYLFDDSFSALDLATDARLRAALRPVTRDATVLLVAQRVSTIRDADLILVLEDGRVVGRGTHHELLDDCPTYQEIVASQLSAEEAA